MKNRICHFSVGMLCILLLPFAICNESYGYIDPGTTNVVFSTIAYLLAGMAVVFSFLITPLRRLYRMFKKKLKNKDRPSL